MLEHQSNNANDPEKRLDFEYAKREQQTNDDQFRWLVSSSDESFCSLNSFSSCNVFNLNLITKTGSIQHIIQFRSRK